MSVLAVVCKQPGRDYDKDSMGWHQATAGCFLAFRSLLDLGAICCVSAPEPRGLRTLGDLCPNLLGLEPGFLERCHRLVLGFVAAVHGADGLLMQLVLSPAMRV